MASVWQKIKDKISPPKPAPDSAPKQSPANNYFNTPTTTIGSGGFQSTTPVQQATGGKVTTIPTSGGGGGSSSRPSGGVAGPMPAGTTPAQEAEFRETGKISTPIVKPTGSSLVQQINIKTSKDAPKPTTYKQGDGFTVTAAPALSGWTAVKQSVSNFGQGVKWRFGFGEKPTNDPWKRVGKEEVYFGGQKETDIVGFKYNYGTKQTTGFDMDTGMAIEKPFIEPITVGDREQEKKLDYGLKTLGVKKEFQSRVTADTTEEQFENINKEYQSAQKDLFSSYEFKGRQTKRTGEKVPALFSLGTDIAVGASTLIPGAQAVTVPLTIGYFTGKGALKASERPELTDAWQDINMAMDRYSKGEDTGSEMLQYYKGLRTEAALNFGVGLAQAPAAINIIGKDINALRVAQLQSQKIKTVGKVLDFGDEKLLKTYSQAKTGTGSIKMRAEFPLFPAEEGKFIVGSGKGTSTVKVLDWFKQGTPKYGANPYSITKESFTGAARGVVDDALIGSTKFGNVKAFVGEGYLVKGDKVTQLNFQGLAETRGQITQGFGGQIKSTKVYPEVKSVKFVKTVGSWDDSLNFVPEKDIFDVSLKSTTKSPIQNVFRITEKGKGVDQLDDFGSGLGRGGGFSSGGSSKSFLQQVQKQSLNFVGASEAGAGFSGEIAKSFQSGITTPVVKSSKFFGSSQVMELFQQPKGESIFTGKSSLDKQVSFLLPSQEMKASPASKTKSFAATGLNNIFKQPSIIKEKQFIIPGLSQPLAQKMQMKTLTTSPFPFGGTAGFAFSPLTMRGFKIPLPSMPSLQLFDYGRRGSGRGKKFRGRYAPTVTAIGLGLKSSQIDKLYKGGAGAFSIRPIISGNKPRRKKYGKGTRRKAR